MVTWAIGLGTIEYTVLKRYLTSLSLLAILYRHVSLKSAVGQTTSID